MPPAASDTAALLSIVEAALDEKYHSVPAVHPNRILATWYVLSVYEDTARILIAGIYEGEQMPAQRVEFLVDRLKYSLRFGLDRVSKVSTDRARADIPRRIVPALYTRASDLLDAGLEFQDANQFCSAAHAGTIQLAEAAGVIQAAIDPAQHDPQYAASEMMGPHEVSTISPSALFYAWSRALIERPALIDLIARRVRLRNRIIRYEYEQDLAVELAAEMYSRREIVPAGWQLPWGCQKTTTLLLNGLAVRCLYHVIAVHFGATHLGLGGCGAESLCMVTTVEQLVRDLELMTSLPVGPIRQFVAYLTYGQGTKRPDPALQPLVPVSEHLLVPCFLILSSNLERNLLSLQARVNKTEFDAQSGLFERDMLESAEKLCSARWPCRRNVFPLGLSGEEIDLLVWDPASRTILVCEMRWMLQPGDPREVQTKKEACRGKVVQLSRKVSWVRQNLSAILTTLGMVSEEEQQAHWTTHGIVVIETFAGTMSPDPECPILPVGIFALGAANARNLPELSAWARSLDWLPREGDEFAIPRRDLTAGGLLVEVLGLEVKVTRGHYLDRVRQELVSQSYRSRTKLQA